MRCMFVRYTPIRHTPVRCTLVRYAREIYTYEIYARYSIAFSPDIEKDAVPYTSNTSSSLGGLWTAAPKL
jgi:hypothetical protein